MKKRVVITGIGLITPLGIGVKDTWTALCSGRSGISEITKFDTAGFTTKFAGEVKNFDPKNFLLKKDANKVQLFIAYAIAATAEAIKDSELKIDTFNADKVGVITGCGLGGLGLLEKSASTLKKKGPQKISPFFIPMLIGNMAPGMISIYFGAKGPNSSVATACAAGTHAIGDAFKIIQTGRAEAMIAGGIESVITPLGLAGFNSMKALSTRNNEPQKASRPFEKDRDGFVMGEGGGILIMETLESAIKRNAKIYAEIAGYGMSGDAYHFTAPAPDGSGAADCMNAAIKDAEITPNMIDYINAHGTSTPLNDLSETIAVKKIFGNHAYNLAISSTKSMTGHLLGGSGGIETAFTALSIFEKIIPATINYENKDKDCDLDYVPNIARKKEINFAMKNSFGFGGTNAALILKKYNEKH
ncbi:MAG: beta-ketoacyl-ACP synthase II [Deltaproteobacteria bacterium]|nr:beta-ketoacyl-ACP synthase II [Deltaproteobacteria bacterium]